MSESRTAHTPGPWELETVPTSIGICHKIGPFGNDTGRIKYACVYDDGSHLQHPNPELLANARLMVAAPELLEALKWVRDKHHRTLAPYCHTQEWDVLIAAIAKAEGGK